MYRSIDYTLVEEYLDQEMECDPGMLMNGITPLYKQVATHFRPKDRKHSCYTKDSIRNAVRDYYEAHNVNPKILVTLCGYERRGREYTAEHRRKMSESAKARWAIRRSINK